MTLLIQYGLIQKLELKIVCIISDTHHENSHTIIKSDTTKITVTYSQIVKVI